MQKATTRNARRGERRAKRSPTEWLELVKQWRSSGQRADEYAHAHDLHPGTLAMWASRLRHEVPGKQVRKSSKGASIFLPVRVSSQRSPGVAISELPIEGGFEVVLTNGRRVRVAGNFRAESLARLLAVVEGGAAC